MPSLGGKYEYTAPRPREGIEHDFAEEKFMKKFAFVAALIVICACVFTACDNGKTLDDFAAQYPDKEKITDMHAENFFKKLGVEIETHIDITPTAMLYIGEFAETDIDKAFTQADVVVVEFKSAIKALAAKGVFESLTSTISPPETTSTCNVSVDGRFVVIVKYAK